MRPVRLLSVKTLAAIAVCMGVIAMSCAKKAADPSPTLHTLFSEYFELQMKAWPTWATSLGDKRYDSLLADISSAAYDKYYTALQDYRNRLKAIDREALADSDRVSYDIFELRLDQSLEAKKFRDWTMPISQQDGPHLDFPSLLNSITFVGESDYINYHKRLLAFPRYIDQTIDNMREGMSAKLVAAQINVEPVPAQMDKIIVTDPTKSVFYEPILANAAKLDSAALQRVAAQLHDAIANGVMPAYRKLRAFVADEYLPMCRKEYGLWALADGAERYAYLIKYHTTLPLTPEQITEIGKRDLAEIHAQMDSIIAKVNFKGDRAKFIEFLHSDKRFYHTDPKGLVADYTAILDSISKRMPEIFGILPKAPCLVKVIEEYRAPEATTAYYQGPAQDGSRPGVYWVNTYDLPSRPKYEMEALSFHESIPGHHLQISIAQELTGLPEFRKHEWFTAFGEGWALYSERLPKELGFYSDPYSDFGRLIYEAWRASRLVVDCGIHYFKWDRQQAIDFMKANFGGTDRNIINEVDRYIASPGQALGYKIGQNKILELRAHAQAELGAAFSLRDFHDQVLNTGCIPLTALEKKIHEWIKTRKAA